MRLHQAVSFSRLFMRAPHGEAVFWPGCALMNLDPRILQKTLEILRRAEPDIAACSCCCGQPTRYLFPDKYEARKNKLHRFLSKQGVKRIYTACPNCFVQLGGTGGVEVIPIWSVLAKHIRPDDICGAAGACVLHDPCPMRNEAEQQEAARALLAMAGAAVAEPSSARERTACCGNFHMMRARDPEKSAQMLDSRLSQFPADMPVTSYCEGCLDAFRSKGRDTVHLLEALFGRSEKRGWGNRIGFTRSIKR